MHILSCWSHPSCEASLTARTGRKGPRWRSNCLVGRPTMDHQPLQDSAGRSSEEVRRSGRRSTDPSIRGPPSATDNLRRISTERENPDRRNLTISDDNMNDESFSFPTARSYSWESQSDGEDRGGAGINRSSGRRDQRKFDMTTPTLIDEIDDGADEEEEMVSLQRARMRQEERGVFIRDESSLRRTPGASMYKSSLQEEHMHSPSLRRTPGAHDMHRSMEGSNVVAHHQEQPDESAVLGFGLTLSTPVATGNRPRKDQGAWEQPSTSTPSRTDQSTAVDNVAMAQPSRPPRAPGSGARPLEQQQRGEFTFTPWTLPRGAQLESRHGACSPNTLRLTEDLGNLLFEEEDSFDQANQQVLQGAVQGSSDSGAGDRDQRELAAESWTSSYIFKSEHVGDIPSRVPRSSMGRGRRGKNDSSSRRFRGHDRPSHSRTNDSHGHQVASFLPYAQQPKPVRGMQASSLGNPFMPGGFDASNQAAYVRGSDQPPPRFFNFGGAFAPPAKDSGVGFRPPVPAPQTQQPPGFSGNMFAGPPTREHFQVRSSPSFTESGANAGTFQSQSFQPLPPMAGASRDSPFQQPFPSPTP